MRIFILLSYNGSPFCGWQKQKNGPSVQESLESAFSLCLRERVEITGAGRTDAGVHALYYVAHLDTSDNKVIKEQQKVLYKINAILPPGVVVHKILHVDDDSHSRFDATNRTYKYYVHNFKSPFLNNYSYYYPYRLNIEKMNHAAKLILGERDFTSMAKLHSGVKTNICNIIHTNWEPASPISFINQNSLFKEENTQTLCFTITANRFLRNMVRAIVGTLLEIGKGNYEPKWIIEVLSRKERGAAGDSVPAHSLFLTGIEYPYPTF